MPETNTPLPRPAADAPFIVRLEWMLAEMDRRQCLAALAPTIAPTIAPTLAPAGTTATMPTMPGTASTSIQREATPNYATI